MHAPNSNYIPTSVVKILVYGTAALTILLESLLMTYQSEVGKIPKLLLLASIFSVFYMGTASLLIFRNRYLSSGIMTIGFYFALSLLILLSWGIGHTAGLLLLGFTIFLSGIVTKPTYITPATVLCILSIFAINSVHNLELILPATNNFQLEFDSIITYVCLFGVFGLTSQAISIYIRKGFEEAEAANNRLKKQKEQLASLLDEERQKIKNAHMEETNQLYRFAKIGQSAVVTLHELSNQIGVLNFDVEDLTEEGARAKVIENIKDSVHQINTLIIETRRRLRLRQISEQFDVVTVINQTIKESRPYVQSRGVVFEAPQLSRCRNLIITGDPIDLTHVVTILIKNACDACSIAKRPKVSVCVKTVSDCVSISVQDNGPGIPDELKEEIFKPGKSTKREGLGIGLYIAKRIVCSQFKGTIQISNSPTTFFINIPLTR